MPTKQVTWQSKTRLSCAGCLPADIVLCVPPELVEDTPHTTINASLTVVTPVYSKCDTTWKYVATYDDAQLIDGANLLGSQITGAFCKGCLTQWVLDQVSNANGPYQLPVRVDGGNYDPGAGVVPTDGQTGGAVTLTYTNNTLFNVAFSPFIDVPETSFDMISGNDWSVELVITPSYAAANTPEVARLKNLSTHPMSTIFGPGAATYPGPTVVAPGDTVTIALHWIFHRLAYAADGTNQVKIFGPRATFIAHAI